MIDDPAHLSRRPAFFIDVIGKDQLFDQAVLIIRVQNCEIAFQSHQFRMTAQQLYSNRLEGAQPRHPLNLHPQ